jgi:purine-binding chemotaxis protein CheW
VGNNKQRKINWDDVHRRMEDWVSDAAGEKGLPAERMRAILAERARMLAKSTEIESGQTTQLVVFSLANETYGIDSDYVREVQPLRDVTPVPCTPAFVVGIINIRGAIYSVIDIREFFGVPKQAITDNTKVILVNAAGLEVGILADDVTGALNVPLAEIKPPLDTKIGTKEEYVRGVTKNMLIILDLEALLGDERIIVRQEVGQ